MATIKKDTANEFEDIKPVTKPKVLKGYQMQIFALNARDLNKLIYIHANGFTLECHPGDLVEVPILVKEILDQNVRVIDPKTGKTEKDYTYQVHKEIYE